MVTFRSLLDFVNPVLDCDDHRIGYEAFRIAYGMLLLLFLIGYARLRHAISGDLSIWDHRQFAKHCIRPWGLHDILEDRTATVLAICLGGLSAIGLLATRVPAGFLWPMIWLSLCSLQGRSLHCNYGGDDVFRLLSIAFLLGFDGEIPSSVVVAQVLLIAIYWNTAVNKLRETEWLSGRAMYGFSKLSMFTRLPLPFMSRPWCYRMASYLAVGIELAIPFLLAFRETVIIGLFAVIGLHFVIQLFFRIHLFQFVMIAGAILFPTDQQYRAMLTLFHVF